MGCSGCANSATPAATQRNEERSAAVGRNQNIRTDKNIGDKKMLLMEMEARGHPGADHLSAIFLSFSGVLENDRYLTETLVTEK